jgi:hypothetical protein
MECKDMRASGAGQLSWNGSIMFGLLCVLGTMTIAVGVQADLQRPPSAKAEELAYLPNGKYLQVAALGYDQLVADLLWLKVVQHYGDGSETTEGFQWAYHAVDVLTDVDPAFAFAYQATGVMLTVWAHLPRESATILAKGVKNNPHVWELPFFLAYNYYYELHEPRVAAEYLRIAAALPKAPDYLPNLAARMTVESGEPAAALEFLQRLHQQVQDQAVRQALEHKMREVVAERDIQFLEEGVRRYIERYRRLPSTLGDLVVGKIIVDIPDEPLGGEYKLDAETGTITSTGLRERLRVHRK